MYSIEGVLNVVTEVFDEPIITLGECIAILRNSDTRGCTVACVASPDQCVFASDAPVINCIVIALLEYLLYVFSGCISHQVCIANASWHVVMCWQLQSRHVCHSNSNET